MIYSIFDRMKSRRDEATSTLLVILNLSDSYSVYPNTLLPTQVLPAPTSTFQTNYPPKIRLLFPTK